MFSDPICAFNGQAYNKFANADLVGDGSQELIGWRTDAVDIYAFDELSNAMELIRSLVGHQAQTPFSADLTNDGRDELILRTWGEAIQVWDPTTGNTAPLITIGTNPLYLASTIRPADVDQDGWIDLVQLADSAGSNNGFIVWKNLGGLAFQRLPFVPLTPGIEDFILEDTDGDGMTEVHFERNTFLLRAEFLPGVNFSAIDTLLIVPAGITSFAFVDIGMDGLRDLLVLQGDNRLSVASGTADPLVFSTLETVLSLDT
ncbi:MAG: VCBS repeat-containing protein [Flavobacteriales bacterium]|nr:VCBS repeat-containing protein [Flavobacteriales bacterium]